MFGHGWVIVYQSRVRACSLWWTLQVVRLYVIMVVCFEGREPRVNMVGVITGKLGTVYGHDGNQCR